MSEFDDFATDLKDSTNKFLSAPRISAAFKAAAKPAMVAGGALATALLIKPLAGIAALTFMGAAIYAGIKGKEAYDKAGSAVSEPPEKGPDLNI
jgi:hypothetical protein